MSEQVILSLKNCHRAAKVRLISNPNLGVWDWNYRNTNIGSIVRPEFAHSAKLNEDNVSIVKDITIELEKWEVVSWSYDFSFEDLYEAAYRAYYSTSFTPDERARRSIVDYERCLISDLENLPKEEHETYIQKFKERVRDLYAKHSRIMSAAITGPAKFPVASQQKHNNVYDRASRDFLEWREKYAAHAAKRIEAAKSPEQKEAEEWSRIESDIRHTAKTISGIDAGTLCLHRSLIVSNLYGRLETLAKNGKPTMLLKSIDLLRQLNEEMKKPIFTQRHKVWKLADLANEIIKKQEETQGKENFEYEFEGGTVVKNYAEDRLQIFHDSKPAPDVIQSLKHNGFRWSRNNGCWQRQLTQNAVYSAARVLYGTDLNNEKRRSFIHNLLESN